EPNIVNWYNHSVYQNSPSALANGTNVPPDTATMDLPNYGLIGAGSDNPNGLPIAWWTSNGNPGPTIPEGTGTPTGPLGYVFAQYHIKAGSAYASLLGNHLVKFRYVAFSDAGNPSGALSSSAANDMANALAVGIAGWAIDNFQIGANGASFTGNTI